VRRLGDDNLTDAERAFLLEWMVDGNGTKAAMKVYRCKRRESAKVQAHKILNRPRVRAAMKKLLDADPDRIRLEENDILRNLSLSLNRNLHDLAKLCPAVKDLPPEVFPYIAGLDVQEFHDDPEHPELATRRQVKIRLSPITEDRALAVKIRGMAAPDKHLTATMAGTPSDWSALLKAVEEEAEAEAEARTEARIAERGDGNSQAGLVPASRQE
jgi:hypothetical protein